MIQLLAGRAGLYIIISLEKSIIAGLIIWNHFIQALFLTVLFPTRFDTTSTSGNDSDEELIKQQLATIAHLRKSIEKTHISTRETDSAIPEQNEAEPVAPSFKLGPAGGPVRPRLARSLERERNFIALSLGDPSRLWDLSIDKDSDVDKSVTAGTEEHSSFSEQAWDFYQVCSIHSS